MQQDSQNQSRTSREGWLLPKPATLPQPSYWPAALALGIIFLLWGVVTTYVVSAIGLVVSAVALAGWIGALRHGQ
jgi:hypothetical protein